jgi:hypothetical protein
MKMTIKATVHDGWFTTVWTREGEESTVSSTRLAYIIDVTDLRDTYYTCERCAHFLVAGEKEHRVLPNVRAAQLLEAIHAGKGEFRFEAYR